MSSFVNRSWLKSLCQKLLAKQSGRYRGSSVKVARNGERAKTHLNLEGLEGRITPTVFVVTDAGNGPGSASDVTLAYALGAALSGDTITFASSLSGDTIAPMATVAISKSITINGLGANNLAISGGGSSAATNEGFRQDAGGHQVFSIVSGATVAITNLTIEDGLNASGGGINNAGTLTLSNVAVSNNYTSHNGGGVYNTTTGTLTVYDSTISNNGSYYNGGGIYNAGTMAVTNSTVADNGYYTNGGGIDNNGTLNLSNSTITGNTCVSSGVGDNGGGVYNYTKTGVQTTILNSIVGGNFATSSSVDISGTVSVANSSLVGINAGFTITSGSNNQIGVAPDLGALAYNGGSTQTIEPGPTSPVLFKGGAATNITSAIGLSDTTIQVANASAIAVTPGDYPITIDHEEMLVTGVNVATNTLTVQRGYNSTTITTHTSGIGVYLATDQRGSAIVVPSQGAYSPPLQVFTVTDPGSGPGSASDVTLPYAVAQGNTSQYSFIGFAATLSGKTITLTSTLTLTSTIFINGLGASELTVSGGGAKGVFSVTSPYASISGLTIEDGSANSGAGVLNTGTLSLASDIITQNSAKSGGAILNAGSLTLAGTVVSSNVASKKGGGIFNVGTLTVDGGSISGNKASSGGGIYSPGTLTISSSTITGNSAVDGGAIFAAGPVTVSDTPLTVDTASGAGSGIYAQGSGAPVSISADTTIAISDNIYLQASPGLTLEGTGALTISGNINLGSVGSLYNESSGNVTITGVISGTATAGSHNGQNFSSLVLANSSLTGYYPLNDAAGSTSVADSSTNHVAGAIVDSSGVSLGVAGAYPALGTAASLNGSGYINVNNASNLGIDGNSWTAMAWVYVTGTNPNGVIFGMVPTTNEGTDQDLQLQIEGGQLFFGEYGDDSSSSTQIPTGQWDFVAWTFNAGTQTIYLNGAQVSQSVGHNDFQGTGTVSIGAGNQTSYLNGDIQQAAFFDSTLSAQQINNLYAASDNVGIANTVGQVGTGTLTLTSANTYLGQTDIIAGTVIVTNNSEFGPANAAGIDISGGTLGLPAGFNYTDAEPLTISGLGVNDVGAIASLSGQSTLSVVPTVSGSGTIGAAAGATLTVNVPLTLAAGTSLSGAGAGVVDLPDAITVAAGTAALGDIGSGTLNVSGAITFPSLSVLNLTGDGNINITNNISLGSQGSIVDSCSGSVNITGVISGAAASSFTITGSGTLTFPSTNPSFLGHTDILGGTLYVYNNSEFGPSNAAGILVSGGTLELAAGFDYTDPEPITLGGTNGAGTVVSLGGNSTFGVNFTFGGAAVFDAVTGTFTVNVPLTLSTNSSFAANGAGVVDLPDAITAAAGSVSLGEEGSGTLNISGAITLSNATTLNLTGSTGGTINITNNVSLGSQGGLNNRSAGNVSITGVITGTSVSGSASISEFTSLILGTPGLTGYYTLNDASGSTTAVDSSSNNFTGTVVGNGVTFGETGAYPALGTAAGLNGSSYINVNTAGNLGIGGDTWTALAWVYDTGTSESIFGMPKQPGGTDEDLHLIIRGGTLYFGEFGDDTSSSTTVPTNQWNLIAFTYDDGTQTIYLNGVQVGQSSGHSNFLATSVPISLGASDESNYLTGAMQDAAFFDSTLSGQEISNLYAAGDNTINATVAQTGSGTLTLTNTNTYEGPTDIYGGTVIVKTNNALGSSTTAGIVINGGTLGLTGGFTYTNPDPITLSGAGFDGNGAIASISGTNTLSVTPIITGAGSVGALTGATLIVNVPLSLAGGTSLSGGGAGTVNLPDAITVDAGTVGLGESGSGTLNVSGSITLPYQSVLDLTGGSSGTMDISNNISLGSAAFSM